MSSCTDKAARTPERRGLVRFDHVGHAWALDPFRRLPFGFRTLCKKCRQAPILILLLFPPLFPTFPHSPHSALGGRVLRPRGSARLGFGGSSAALGDGSARSEPSAKSVGKPPFLLYQCFPTFPHSPHSVLRGRAEGARLGFGGSSAALGNGSARSGPLQKVSADPYFYSTSFSPLFPTLPTRRSGAVRCLLALAKWPRGFVWR